MAVTATASDASQAAAAARRMMLATKVGPAGLVANKRVFFTALFACLGGLLYGYNQGVFSGVLAMHSFKRHVNLPFLYKPRLKELMVRYRWVIRCQIHQRRDGLLRSWSLVLGQEHCCPGFWPRCCLGSMRFLRMWGFSSSVLLFKQLRRSVGRKRFWRVVSSLVLESEGWLCAARCTVLRFVNIPGRCGYPLDKADLW